MTELAERPTELDTDDKEAAYIQVIKAMRGGNKRAALEAFRVWAEMAKPGSQNENIEVLRDARRHIASAVLNERDYKKAYERSTDALDALAFEWEHCEVLDRYKVTKPTLIDVNDEGEMHRIQEGLARGVYLTSDKQMKKMVRVEPVPRVGWTYLLVRKADFEWTMPEPTPDKVRWRDIYARFAQAAQSAPHSLTDQDRQDAFGVEVLDRAGHTCHCSRRMWYAQVDCVCSVGDCDD